MVMGLTSFTIFLSIIWFLLYWILGGVFFAVMAILRLGRVRKVRFSCLFTIYALVCAIVSANAGIHFSTAAIVACTANVTTKAQAIVAVVGCGFTGVVGMFVTGAIVLILGGFVILAISKSKTKSWINLEQPEDIEAIEVIKPANESRFF